MLNKPFTIKVKNSGIVELAAVKDLPDGNLYIAEGRKSIPFDIKRVYFINNLANPKARRGKHAHHELRQALFCISGSFVLHLDDGITKQRITMNDPSVGVLIGPQLWHTMASFSYDCIILVFASDHYCEDDYIREYKAFIELLQKPQGN